MHGGKYPGADSDGSSISTEYVSSLLVTEHVSSRQLFDALCGGGDNFGDIKNDDNNGGNV